MNKTPKEICPAIETCKTIFIPWAKITPAVAGIIVVACMLGWGASKLVADLASSEDLHNLDKRVSKIEYQYRGIDVKLDTLISRSK